MQRGGIPSGERVLPQVQPRWVLSCWDPCGGRAVVQGHLCRHQGQDRHSCPLPGLEPLCSENPPPWEAWSFWGTEEGGALNPRIAPAASSLSHEAPTTLHRGRAVGCGPSICGQRTGVQRGHHIRARSPCPRRPHIVPENSHLPQSCGSLMWWETAWQNAGPWGHLRCLSVPVGGVTPASRWQ